jgi:hypothetical protein
MTIKISIALATAAADAIAAAVDVGVPLSTLVIYDGAEPADADVAVTTQVALVTFELPAPAFGAAAPVAGGAQITANAIPEVDADADGTATWFRIYDGDGLPILQGDVTDTLGSGNLKVSSTAIVDGIAVEIVSMTFRQLTGG